MYNRDYLNKYAEQSRIEKLNAKRERLPNHIRAEAGVGKAFFSICMFNDIGSEYGIIDFCRALPEKEDLHQFHCWYWSDMKPELRKEIEAAIESAMHKIMNKIYPDYKIPGTNVEEMPSDDPLPAKESSDSWFKSWFK